MRQVIKSAYRLSCYVLGSVVGRIIYSPEHFPRGRCFSRWDSEGWAWVLADFLGRTLLHRNIGTPWPVSPLAKVGRNVTFDPDDLAIFQGCGCYFQTWHGTIRVGKGTHIAQNVGLITSNHDLNDPSRTGRTGDISLGEQCWIGMNCVILPGVTLGDHTVVGAGSIVTRSFPDGHCVIAGNPAKVIKRI